MHCFNNQEHLRSKYSTIEMGRTHKKPSQSKNSKNAAAKETGKEQKIKTIPEDDEDMNSGFGNYLRSGEGMEMMKLFIIGNSMIVLITFAWPHIQESINILREMFFDNN